MGFGSSGYVAAGIFTGEPESVWCSNMYQLKTQTPNRCHVWRTHIIAYDYGVWEFVRSVFYSLSE